MCVNDSDVLLSRVLPPSFSFIINFLPAGFGWFIHISLFPYAGSVTVIIFAAPAYYTICAVR